MPFVRVAACVAKRDELQISVACTKVCSVPKCGLYQTVACTKVWPVPKCGLYQSEARTKVQSNQCGLSPPPRVVSTSQWRVDNCTTCTKVLTVPPEKDWVNYNLNLCQSATPDLVQCSKTASSKCLIYYRPNNSPGYAPCGGPTEACNLPTLVLGSIQ